MRLSLVMNSGKGVQVQLNSWSLFHLQRVANTLSQTCNKVAINFSSRPEATKIAVNMF